MPSSNKPEALELLDGTVTHLRRVFSKRNRLTRSLEDQLLGILSHWGRHRLRGATGVHPGMKKMSDWGRCSKRTAQRNYRQLEIWNVIRPLANGRGGRGLAPVFTVDLVALGRVLIFVQMNPHPRLLDKLRFLQDRLDRNPIKKGATMNDKKDDSVSPRIESIQTSFLHTDVCAKVLPRDRRCTATVRATLS